MVEKPQLATSRSPIPSQLKVSGCRQPVAQSHGRAENTVALGVTVSREDPLLVKGLEDRWV